MNIKENYQQYVSRYASEVATLKRKNTGFITGELLAFGGILAFLICYFALDGDTQNYLMGAVLCLIAYLGIRRLDDKNKEKIEHLSALLKVYQDEIKALEGDFSPFETGDSYQNPQHSYSFDLDVFGKSSLFNRICRTITSGGSEALARNLTRETPLSLEDIKRRRDLQKELAGEGENWRMEFLALGEKDRSQTADGKRMNGIGGSCDYERNGFISIFTTQSTTKNGCISAIVPMCSHVDSTEHDVDVIVTEQGVADLRGKGPLRRAKEIIENCAHPDYRPMLREYLKFAEKGHEPQSMRAALAMHDTFLKKGDMRLTDFGEYLK